MKEDSKLNLGRDSAKEEVGVGARE